MNITLLIIRFSVIVFFAIPIIYISYQILKKSPLGPPLSTARENQYGWALEVNANLYRTVTVEIAEAKSAFSHYNRNPHVVPGISYVMISENTHTAIATRLNKAEAKLEELGIDISTLNVIK